MGQTREEIQFQSIQFFHFSLFPLRLRHQFFSSPLFHDKGTYGINYNSKQQNIQHYHIRTQPKRREYFYFYLFIGKHISIISFQLDMQYVVAGRKSRK